MCFWSFQIFVPPSNICTLFNLFYMLNCSRSLLILTNFIIVIFNVILSFFFNFFFAFHQNDLNKLKLVNLFRLSKFFRKQIRNPGKCFDNILYNWNDFQNIKKDLALYIPPPNKWKLIHKIFSLKRVKSWPQKLRQVIINPELTYAVPYVAL